MRKLLSPVLAILALCFVTGAGPAPFKVLCLGDSLTEGYGVPHDAAWPALLQKELDAKGKKGVEIVNAGVSGSTTASGVSRLKWQLKAEPKPKVLVLALGANDGLRGLDLKAARKALTDTVKLAKENGMQVLLAGMQIPPNYGAAYTDEFQRMFPEVAKAEGATLIPFLLEGVAADKSLNQADGIHPNEAGHKLVAKTVLKSLEPLLP